MKDFFTIGSDRLQIQVVKPGSSVYGRTRFNWNCFINRITLDGQVEFAEPEQRDAALTSSYGAGICSEYQHPIAFDEAGVGEEYPRLGNGYLLKTDKPFNFMINEPCRPFPTVWTVDDSSVTFTTDMALCNGFAGREEKSVTVEDNTITVHTKLTNYGTRDIVAQEYNHNFLSLGGEPVSPDYTMHLPGFKNIAGGKFMGDNLYGDDENQCLRLHRVPDRPYMTFLDDVGQGDAAYAYKLTSKNSEISVEERDSFAPARAVVWGVGHTMCAEVFVQVDVKPGCSQEWTRKWTFEK